MSLKLETFLAISTTPRSTAFSWQKKSSGKKQAFLQELVKHAYNETCPTPVAPIKRGRLRKVEHSPIEQSISFEQLFVAYQQIAQGKLPLKRIAEQLKLDIPRRAASLANECLLIAAIPLSPERPKSPT